jgi:hypothetical protein
MSVSYAVEELQSFGYAGAIFQECTEKRRALLKRPINAGKTMAGVAGLEPVTSAVTGQRSNQLSYTPAWGVEKIVKLSRFVNVQP